MEMLEYIAECGRCEVLGLVRRTYQSLLASGLLREEGIYLAVTASGEKLVSAGARLKLGVYRRTGRPWHPVYNPDANISFSGFPCADDR
jgi:hypothetical protein